MILAVATPDPRARLVQSGLDRNRLSYRWLSEQIDANHVSVPKWLRGDAVPRDRGVWDRMLTAIREYESRSSTTTEVTVARAGIRQIPVYPGLSAGSLTTMHADVDVLEIKDWGNGRQRWARVIDGYSMADDLLPGDIVVFEDRPAQPYHVVHAFAPDGSDTVKVLRSTNGRFELVPINPDYQTIPGDGMECRGVAVMHIRRKGEDVVTTTEYPHGMRHRDLSRG